jgi:hypothetical protein
MTFLAPLYNKIKGEYFGISSSLIGLVGGLTACALYAISLPFGFDATWVSQVGIGPNGSNYLFNATIIIFAIIFLFFGFAITDWLWGRSRIVNFLSIILAILNVISVTGAIMVGSNPMHTNQYVHVIGAQMYFICILVYALVIWITLGFAHESSKVFNLATIILLGFAMFYAPIFANAVSAYYPGHTFLTISFDQFIEVMSSMKPELNGVRIVEWTLLIAVFIWIFILAIHFRQRAHKSLIEK